MIGRIQGSTSSPWEVQREREGKKKMGERREGRGGKEGESKRERERERERESKRKREKGKKGLQMMQICSEINCCHRNTSVQ